MDNAKHADNDQLEMLLLGDEGSPTSAEIVRHVESCDLCQQRLTQIVSLDETDQEVNQLLKGFFGGDSGGAGDSRHTFGEMPSREMPLRKRSEIVSKDLEVDLGPPSHPEMLGRLGRYEIERKIGAGGMGIVLKGIDTELHRPVAIKVLAPHLARNGAARQRFGRESRAAAAVVHEHVVAIHNVESEGETPFIVMQYVSGESLQTRVERLGPLKAQQILRIGIQAASGLAAAHEQGIVHRDVKPANILMEEGVERVLLTDFGLARTVDDASLTHTGIVAGTPHYMSPEQANGNAVDYRSDLFSLGSVLYFVATGHPPFRAERAMGVLNRICHEPHRPAWQVNPDVPIELSDVIDRLLEKRPSKRFGSAIAARDGMARILQQLQSRRMTMSSRFRTWVRRRSSSSWVGVALTSILTSLLLGGLILAMGYQWLDRFQRALPLGGRRTPRTSMESPNENVPSQPRDTSVQEGQSAIVMMGLDTLDRSEFTREVVELHRSLDVVERNQVVSPNPIDWRKEIRDVQRELDRLDRHP